MRTTTLARAAAVTTASVLALSLTSGPATADDSAAAAYAPDATPSARTAAPFEFAGADQAPAGTKRPAVATINKIRVNSSVLFRKGDNSVDIGFDGDFGTSNSTPPTKVVVTLRVNGKNHENVPVYYDSEADVNFFNTKSGWGSGKSQVLNTTVTYGDGTKSADGTDSNSFYLRRLVRVTASKPFVVTVYSPGNKIKFQAKTFKVFNPSKGTYVSLGKIRLQYQKSSGNWKTLTNIKLNSNGSGSYTYHAPTRTYRLYVPTTANVYGGATQGVTG